MRHGEALVDAAFGSLESFDADLLGGVSIFCHIIPHMKLLFSPSLILSGILVHIDHQISQAGTHTSLMSLVA